MARKLPGRFIARNKLALAVATALVPLASAQSQTTTNTLPTGGVVAAGAATISQPAANKLQIDQASDKAVLNWQSFSIGSGAWVNFTQPSASAIALNRVQGTNPSEIFGRLTANGQVFLSNPNGVLFAPGASVDVGGLFATTLSINDADFLAGNYSFYNAGGAGSVVNQGAITAGSYAALAAPQVRNDGVIVAQSGTVALAAGDRVSLDMVGDGLISISVDQAAMNASAINSGTIQADGGRVLLTARSANALLDTVVNNGGVIQANSLVERNGEIVLDGGTAGTVANTGTVHAASADAATTGGTVSLIGQSITLFDASRIDATGDAAGGAVNVSAGAITELGSGSIAAGTLTATASGTALLSGANAISTLNVPLVGTAPGVASNFTLNNTGALVVTNLRAGGTVSLNNAGTVTLDATTHDARITSSGGQNITADGLVLHGQNDHTAAITNNGGNQAIIIGGGGITLDVAADGRGAAQIANSPGAVGSNGTQTVSTTGSLTVVGGSTAAGSRNSGVFQNQTGRQTITASSIALQAAIASVNNAGAVISSNGSQEINVASGAIRLTGGGIGLNNRAQIASAADQTINGDADIFVTGGSSGAGTNATNTSNRALISAGGLQTINAHDVTLQAGSGGTDTFAAITSNTQNITATGDISITGGSNSGDSNGARIGAPGSTTTGTHLTLTAHNVTLTGGTTDSGAAIGNSANSPGLQNTITIAASGDIRINGGDGNGARIGSPNGDTGGGSIDIEAAGDIALNGGVHAANIRTGGDLKLHGASISETGNTQILANSLTLTADGSAQLGGSNQISVFNGTSGSEMLLNNSGALSITGINASGTLTLTNAGSLTLLAAGTQNAEVTSVGGQTVTADSINLIAQDGRRARLTNNGFGDQVITATAGDIDLVAVNGAGTAKIVQGQPGAGGIGNQTVSAAGALNVEGGNSGGTSTGLIQSGVFQNTFGTQTVNAQSISLRGSDFVASGAALITNQGGGGDQAINVVGDIRVTGGAAASGNRAGILTNGNQTVAAGGDIFITGGANGGGVATNFSSNTAAIDDRGVDKQQTVSARNIVVTSGSGGIDTAATLTGFHQVIAASGNVQVTGSSGNTGTFNGARIGGPGSNATDLTLSADNVYVTAGAASGAAIGGNAISSASTDITITAAHDVVLNGAPTRGVRIGAAPGIAPGAGAIQITAGGNIALSGPGASTSINTAGDVSLTAGGSISESGNALVRAGSLATTSGSSTALGGANQVASFNGTSGGDVVLNNSGALQITGLTSPMNVAVTNAGGITWNASTSVLGSMSITTTGAGSDLLVTGVVFGGLAMDVNVAGTVSILGDGPGALASLVTGGMQTINAGGLALTGQNGGTASLSSAGPQLVTVTDGSVDIQAFSGGSAQVIGNGAPQTLRVIDGDHLNVAGVGGFAGINNNAGLQTISLTGAGRNALSVGSAGALGSSQIFATSQVITAGAAGEAGSISIAGPATAASASISTAGIAGGTQTIATSGQLSITGGSSSTFSSASILHGGSGQQSVSAGSIAITGGGAGNRNAAFLVSAGGGDQLIEVAGDFSVTAGSVGIGNRANVSSSGNQTIDVGGDLVITGGAGGGGRTNNGTSNGAFIQASNPARQETISARNITLNAGSGGSDTFASITAANQTITATEDVRLNGGSNTSIDGSGARIGGLRSPAGPTNLTLKARDVILTGGTMAGNGAALGNNAEIPEGQTINIEASRDVILASGSGAGARIGANNDKPALPGDISITAGRDIQLNGIDHSATIRTTGNVSLTAGNAISEAAKGSITANVLTTTSAGATELGGQNVVSAFNATSGGDVLLNNSGALDITGLSGTNATVSNMGSVTWSATAFLPGTLSLAAAGPGSDLLVTGTAFAGTGMDIDVSGTVTVLGATPGALASLSTGGAQNINATGLAVTAQNGGSASLAGAAQSILITGGSVDVQAFDNGSAQVLATGPQSIAVLNGDHFNVNGASGFALVQAMPGNSQSVSLTGSGRNAITLGSTGALGLSQLSASSQWISAGSDGESGSISIVGGAAGVPASIFTFGSASGTQSVSTSGELSITGGDAASGTSAGIFHSAGGAQTIKAGAITITGGSAGNANGAFVSSGRGGDQVINVVGDLTIKAGSAGSINRAGISGSGNQAINVGGDITVSGGDGGAGRTSDNTSNGAFIIASNAARSQTISARNITLNAGSGGNDTFASITGATQTITASEDVRLNGGSNVTIDGSGVRIGGLRVPETTTNLTLNARDVVLTGGSAAGSGAALGGNPGGTAGQTITVNASRDFIMNSDTGSGARVGTRGDEPAGPGNITINAARDIQLNGVAQPTTIRTADDVTLNAGGTISEASNGSIAAHLLTTVSGGSTLLGGPNELSGFNATSTGGSVLLTNTGALEVTGLDAFGDATLDNTGNVTISGPWTAGGTTTITVHSDLSLLDKLTSHDVFLTATSGSIQEGPTGGIDASSLTTSSVGDTTLSGNNTVSTFSASSDGGAITLNNSGPLTVTSLQTTGAIELTNDGVLTLETPVDTTGQLTIASHGDLKLTDSVTAGDLVVRSEGGNLTIGGADLLASVVLHGTRSLTLEAPGQVLVRGSDCTIGAGAYALSDGALTVNAGSFALVGGAAPFAPAVAAGNVVNVTTAGDLTLTGGMGTYSPALLFGGTAIDLTVGGTLRINGGVDDTSFARVQTATRDGEIHITFTNEAGDYVVDGLDGRIKHGQDGFYTGIVPAKPGDTFFVSYP